MSVSSTIREPRSQFSQIQISQQQQQQQQQSDSMETDQTPILTRLSKPTISSLLLSPFSTTTTESPAKKKGATFRGLGCTAAAAQVSVPAVIRSSAEWDEGKRVKKKKGLKQQKMKKKENAIGDFSGGNGSNGSNDGNGNGGNLGGCMVMQDVWCGPGIGLSSDAVVESVDCVVTRRNVNSTRGKVDGVGERVNQRERERDRDRERERERPCSGRRAAVNLESLSFLDANPAFMTRPESEVLGRRNYRHVRHPSPDELAEIMFLQNTFIMGGRLDRFSNLRLDIDHMSYEQLLELGDRIGYVCTGLKEDEIDCCVRRTKISVSIEQSLQPQTVLDKKCSICQEEYEAEDELGRLDCGHGFHIECIRQWLEHKNACPVCKKAPVSHG